MVFGGPIDRECASRATCVWTRIATKRGLASRPRKGVACVASHALINGRPIRRVFASRAACVRTIVARIYGLTASIVSCSKICAANFIVHSVLLLVPSFGKASVERARGLTAIQHVLIVVYCTGDCAWGPYVIINTF